MNKHHIKKALISAQAFLNKDPTFESIVNMCSLIPRNNDWRIWEDEEKNILRLHKNKACHIYPSKETQTDTKDIFKRSRPFQIMRASYWVLFGLNDVESMCWFVGLDDKLRSCYFVNNQWKKNQAPLLSGIHILRFIAEQKHTPHLRSVKLPKFKKAYSMEITKHNIDAIKKKKVLIIKELKYGS